MDGEAVPLRPNSHEQIVQNGVRPHPGLAAGHVRIALRLIPMDVRTHRTKNARDIPLAKRMVEVLQKAYVVHARSSDVNCCPLLPTLVPLAPATPAASRPS